MRWVISRFLAAGLAIVAALMAPIPALADPAAQDLSARALALARVVEAENLFARKADWDALLLRAKTASPDERMLAFFKVASYHLSQGDNASAEAKADALQAEAARYRSRRFLDLARIVKYAAAEEMKYAEPLLAVGAASHDPVVQAAALAMGGEVYREGGEMVDAVARLVQGLRLMEGRDPIMAFLKVDALGYLALARAELGDTDGAMRDYDVLIDLARRNPRQFDGVTFLFNFSLLFSRLEMHDLARDIGRIERSVAIKTDSPIEVFYAYALCANLARERADWGEAFSCSDRALKQSVRDEDYAVHVRWTRALAAAKRGDVATAERDRARIASESFFTDNADGRVRWMQFEAALLRAKGDLGGAVEAIEKYAFMVNRLTDERSQRGAVQLRKQLEEDLAIARERAEDAALLAQRQRWIIALGIGIVLITALALVWRLRAEQSARRLLTQARASLDSRAQLLRSAMVAIGADAETAQCEPPAKGTTLAQLEWLLREIDRRDQTLRESVEALAIAREAAESASKAKSDFMAVMSHELRTPMNAIIGYTDLVREVVLEGANVDPCDLDRISAASARLLRLINQILRYEKSRHAPEAVALAPVPLDAMFADVAAIVTPIAKRGSVRICVDVGPDARLVMADSEKLAQVLTNIAGNAAKFTHEGTITLSARRDAETIVIEVRDTGVGIPQDKCASIFDAFTQVDSSLTRRFEGTGLGLAISKSFVEQMGGTISVESVEGQGSCFSICLPALALDCELAA